MKFAESKLFAAKIAVCNAIGYIVSVGGPTIIDQLIKHNSVYGPRIYPLGSLVFLGFIPVALVSYIFNINNRTAEVRSSLTFLSLVILTWLTLPYFKPEFPHLWVLLVPVVFGLSTSVSVYIHNYEIDSEIIFIGDISEQVKIEKIKLEYETWFRLFLTVLTGYTVIAITYLTKVPEIVKMFTPNDEEQFILQGGFSVSICIAAMVFMVTVCLEMIKKITSIKNKMTCIPKPANELQSGVVVNNL